MADVKVKAPTKRQNFEGIMNFLAENGKSDWAKVMEHEIELLARKSSKGGALNENQKENMALVEIVKDILAELPEDSHGMTIGELLKDERISSFETKNPNGVTSQRLTGVLTPLTAEGGDLVREVVKKVAYFRLAYGEVKGIED